ncbi:serine-protein kinase ATM [Nematocida ausubeli]|nr:serine-protein kinase ATM [Nematocida ausubeli]
MAMEVEDKLFAILNTATKENALFLALNTLMEIFCRVRQLPNKVDDEAYRKYREMISGHFCANEQEKDKKERRASKSAPKRKGILYRSNSMHECKRALAGFSLHRLGVCLGRIIQIYARKYQRIDNEAILNIASRICTEAKELMNNQSQIKVLQDFKAHIVDPLLMCIRCVKNSNPDIILTALMDLHRIECSSSDKKAWVEIIYEHAEHFPAKTRMFLLKYARCNGHAWGPSLFLYCLYAERLTVSHFIKLFKEIEVADIMWAENAEHLVYFMQLLFIGKYISASCKKTVLEQFIQKLIDQSITSAYTLSLATARSVFGQTKCLCMLGTLLYIARDMQLEIKVPPSLQTSIGSVMALFYRKIDYSLLHDAIRTQEPSSLFYVYCVLVEYPSAIHNINADRVLKSFKYGPSCGSPILEYFYILTRYEVEWNRVRNRPMQCGMCRKKYTQNTNESGRYFSLEKGYEESITNTQKLKRSKKERSSCLQGTQEAIEAQRQVACKGRHKRPYQHQICSMCALERALCTPPASKRSILLLIIEGSAAEIRAYLRKNSKTVNGLAVLLEKIYPLVYVPVKSNQTLKHLDICEYFVYPERVRLLPSIELAPQRIEELKHVFSKDDAERRTIWLLFLEAGLWDIYCVPIVLVEEFHLQVLIRSPDISQEICKKHCRKREEHIIELGVRVLEEQVSVTEEEKSNVIATLWALSRSTPLKSISADIANYLLKKKKRCNSQYFSDFVKTFTSSINEQKPKKPARKIGDVEDCLESAKKIVQEIVQTNIYSDGSEIPAISPAELMKMKSLVFQQTSCLLLEEQACIQEYFIHKSIPYSVYEQSYRLVCDANTKIREIVDVYYTEEFKERTRPEESTKILKDSCVFLVDGMMRTVYPEKYFLFFILTKAINNAKELSYLEKHAIVHGLEYLYAYDKELFRELNRLYKEKYTAFAPGSEKTVQPESRIETSLLETQEQILMQHQVAMYVSLLYGEEEKSENSSDKLPLVLRRHGALSVEKEKIILSQYQNRFFTVHYNYSDVESVVEYYFKEIVPIASMRMLVFICTVPSSEKMKTVSCYASRDFLRIFYYASTSLPIPANYPYLEISEMLRQDKQGNLSGRNIASQHANQEIQMYMNRETDDGFISHPSTVRRTFDLLAAEKILEAAEKLSRWSNAVDKTCQIDYLLFSATIRTEHSEYIDFLQSKKVLHRFQFITSIHTGHPLVEADDEIEEILYVCTRSHKDISEALNRKRTLSKSALHAMVRALESKWFKMPAESYYVRTGKKIDALQNTILSELPHPLKKRRRRKLSAAISLFKISKRIHTFKDPFLLLTELEEDLKKEMKKFEITEGSLEARTNRKMPRHIDVCTNLLSKAVAAKIEHVLNEFESMPIDILNNYVRPAERLYFGKHELYVLETLAKTCLTIFNRNTSAPRSTAKVATASAGNKLQSALLQKEHAVIQEIEEYKAKKRTEVEEASYSMGINLYITLAQRSRKLQHIISLIHLLFSENAPEDIIEQISLAAIPVESFFPLKQQIISKYFHMLSCQKKDWLCTHLSSIISQMILTEPFSVVYDILLRERSTNKKISIPDSVRVQAEAAIATYKTIYKQGQSLLPINASFPSNTPILSQEIRGSVVCIQSVQRNAKVLSGINKPILISILGTDGIVYKEIIKRNDDLKQDILSTQVFSYMNTVLSESVHTQNIKERVRTYKILGLDKLFGIIEFIDQAEPVGSVIEGLHKKHFPKEISSAKCREIMQRYINAPIDVKTKTLAYLQSKYSPALKRVFEGKGPFEYYKERRSFTNSFSILSIATYVLGLGDRHPQNILLDRKSKELINIDLNLIFDQGKALSISEKVPFRMTRNFQQAILTNSAQSYEKTMNSFLAALKDSKENLLVFVSILRSEPLQRWRAIQRVSQESTLFSDYKSIQERMKDKLNGIEDGFILSNPAHVQCLVQRAIDLSNQASIYPGWSPWM